MSASYRTLLIEDNPGDARLIREMLQSPATTTFEVETAERLSDGLQRLEDRVFDAVLLDLGLPDSQGLATFARLHAAAPVTPVVVMTGNADLDLAVRAVQAGAQDYLVKGQVHGNLVTRSVRYAVERQRAEAALRESEAKYRCLVEKLHEGICAVDAEGRITYANPRMAELLGYAASELPAILGRPAFDFMTAAGIEFARAALGRRRQGATESYPFDFLRKDGVLVNTFVEVGPILDSNGVHLGSLAAIRDVTEARRAEARIERLSRLYRTTSEINQLIVRERGRQRLLNEACRILVETGEFRLAWVGVPDLQANLLRPAASAGATEFLDGIEVRLDVSPQGQGPHGQAYRDRVVALAQDWATDASVGPWRERGLSLGIRSSAALPIVQGQRLVGVLSVDAGTPNAFDEEVVRLLDELVDDLSLAFRGIEESERRERAERATRQSEQRLRALAAATFEGICFSAEGVLVDANEQYAAMFGYERADLDGKPIAQMVAPQSRGSVAKKVRDNVLDPYEHLALRKDGTAFPVEVRSQLMTLQDRRLRVTAVRDLTEGKRAEAELRASEARLKDAQRIARIGNWELDLVSNALTWSDEAYEIFEVQRDAFAGTYEAFAALVHPDDRQLVNRAYWDSVKTRTPYDAHHRLLLAGGRVRYVHERGETLYDERGVALRTSGTVQDVTAERESEQALRKLSEAVEQASVSMVITDNQGRIEYVNRMFCETTGYTPDEIVGKNPRILKSGATSPETYREMWATITAGETWNGELCNKKKNGEPFWERVVIAPVRDDHGRTTHFIASKLDITRSRQLEQELAQAQKMEAVGRLAGGVAHDFNNLLGVIMGYAELLQRRPSDDEPSRRKLEQIAKAAERGASLTRQLLAFSRKQVLQPRALDLNEVVKDIEPMVRRLIGEDVRLATDLRVDLGLVMADPGQMEQAIMNLAVNARDAMPQGGTLTIRTTRHIPGDSPVRPESPADACVEVSVQDTGCGMDAATLAHIFEPFFTTKEAGKGTGLGLATVYGIVKQSGGQIQVESAPGAGTTFRIWLPMVEGVVERKATPVQEATLLKGSETILVLEDDAALRAIVQETLGLAGYVVLTASRPEEGRALLRAHAFQVDLLLSDVIMPGMSGPDFAEEVAASRPGTRILYMSGYTDESLARRRILDTGARLLQKPVTPQALLREVRATLDGPAVFHEPAKALPEA